MRPATECSPQSLIAYLDDQLDSALHEQLFQHLEHCCSCRQQMEVAAGSADDWATAREALADFSPGEQGEVAKSVSSSHASPSDLVSFLRFLSPSDDPRAAGRIGSFEITGIVGSGGMGIVLKARDPALDRFIAIKILAPHLASSPSARKRFAREARAAAAVIHDNVIPIYQVAEWNGLPYLVMPYLPDPSLQQRLDSEGRFDMESVLSIGMQVARGLHAAHAQGLVHRDIKPANVLLWKGTERAVITDFGLARAADDASLTRAGMLTGTPHYMSPEQARGEHIDQSSDLFSLGSLLFAMAAGHPPVTAESGSDTIERISKGALPSLGSVMTDTPSWFIHLVDWLHRRDPRQRPQSADQVAGLLEQCLAHQRQPEKNPLPGLLIEVRENSNRLLHAAMLVSAFLVGLAGMATAFRHDDRSIKPGVESVRISQQSKTTAQPSEMARHEDGDQQSWHGVRSELEKLGIQADELESRWGTTWPTLERSY